MILKPAFLRILLSVFAFLALGLPMLFQPRAVTTHVISAIEAGGHISCAIVDGGLKCWGYNAEGEVGDGTTIERHIPVDVSGLNTGATTVSAGEYHACAITTTGGLKCWGWNSYGQLGDGTTTKSIIPIDVHGLTSDVTAVSLGYEHSCAITTGGGVKCWGWNFSGQLGDGSETNRPTPVDVSGLTTGVSAVSAAGLHTCALTTGGGVKCWGDNYYGQLGNGTNYNSNTPVDVSGLTSGVTAISASGEHSCALTTGGEVKCWGENTYGQLGNNSTTDSNIPVDVSGLTAGVTAISAGSSHTCALMTTGTVKCWGGNGHGQLGDGTTTDSHVPVDVSGLITAVTAVSAKGGHTCALTTGAVVKCWGDNYYGQLGNDTKTDSNIPVDVIGLLPPVNLYLPLVQNLNTPVPPTPTFTSSPTFTPTITTTPATATPTRTPTPNTSPKAGGWQVSSSSVPIYSSTSGFRVSGNSITQFGVWIYPPANPCSFLALHSTSTSISGNSFSFSDWGGDFTVSGSFSSSTSASGNIHIYYNSFPGGCSMSSQTYNGTWSATWTGN